MANTEYSEIRTVEFYAETSWYGVNDLSSDDPDMSRAAYQFDNHANLPIQSLMKGCVLNDNGTVNYYLNPADWSLQAGGGASNLDGSDGQVMVEIPGHWYLDWNNDDDHIFGISLTEITGWNEYETMYVSAYEATIQRSVEKLSSVVNLDVDYRGGNNRSDWDAQDNTLLGKPTDGRIQQIGGYGDDYRTKAQNRGGLWHPHTWKARTDLIRLIIIEYNTKNCQKAVNAVLDGDGYKQGGLGSGVTTMIGGDLTAFNDQQAFIPCGTSDSLANGSGEVNYTVPMDTPVDVKVARYRGVENVFGHMWELLEGVVVAVDIANEIISLYLADDPADFTSSSEVGLRFSTYIPWEENGSITQLNLNDMVPVTTIDPPNYALKYCDRGFGNGDETTPAVPYNHYRSGGYSYTSVGVGSAGIFCMKADNYYEQKYYYLGTRLNCLPNGY